VRTLIKLALVALGIRAFLRWRERRRDAQAPPAATVEEADPADELRRKLAESRDDAADAAEEPPTADVPERRAEVHEQGRATLDEMKSPDES
jgi:hypothetical protein